MKYEKFTNKFIDLLSYANPIILLLYYGNFYFEIIS